MQIAIVGAGLAGLSLCSSLLSLGLEVTLFDPKGVGGGASGVATGLLHPFPGKRASRSWRASEGMQATGHLLNEAEKSLGRPVALRSGIFRPAISDQQKKDFQALLDPDAHFQKMEAPGMVPSEGLWIPSGISVYSRLYLEGLYLSCQKRGAQLVKRAWEEKDLASFRFVVFASGWELIDHPLCQKLPLRIALGQTVVARLEEPIPFSIASLGHVSVTEDPFICQIGSTYEHRRNPDPKQITALLEKVAHFFPKAPQLPRLETRCGIRIAPKDGHIPIAEQLDEQIWVFTGLGSRGMLYHALIGQELAERIKKAL